MSSSVLSRYRSHRQQRLLNNEPNKRAKILSSYDFVPRYHERSRKPSYQFQYYDILTNEEVKQHPNFTYQLRPRVVSIGQNVKLICTYSAVPNAKINWFKDRMALDNSATNYKISNMNGVCKIEIFSVTVDDNGIYKCVAENLYGSAETSCQLFVTGGKSNKRSLSMNSLISRSEYRKSISNANESSSRINTENENIRKVSLTNDIPPPQRRRSSVRLPLVEEDLSDVTVYSGGIMQLKCRIKDRNVPDVKWIKDDQSIDQSGRVITEIVDGIATLTIYTVTLEDAGLYKCIITNDVGVVESVAEVTVKNAIDSEISDTNSDTNTDELANDNVKENEQNKVNDNDKPDETVHIDAVGKQEVSTVDEDEQQRGDQPIPLKFLKFLESQSLTEGNDLIMKCEVEGGEQNNVEITWFRNDKAIPESNDFERGNEGNTYFMKITDILPDDAGIFTVEFKNSISSINCSCSIIIEEDDNKTRDPQIEQFPKSANCKSGSKVQFTCKAKSKAKLIGKWFINDNVLKEDAKHNVSYNATSKLFKLDISSVSANDYGKYRLEVIKDTVKKTDPILLVFNLHSI
ncbi:hypothetical protein GJ496_004612 [Pomphorhynchus laevis]|nr:hypothetical protein GJ496_004612 [Pomphorhynchus laevis]